MTLTHRKFAFLVAVVLVVGAAFNLFVLQDKKRMSAAPSVIAGTERIPSGKSDTPAALATVATTTPEGTPDAIGVPVATSANTAPEVTRGVQRELNARGYEAGPPDGVAGLVTRAAILAYEHDFGLALTARPSEGLLSRIVLGSATASGAVAGDTTPLTPEAEGVVITVKQSLAALGRQVGPIDAGITPQLRRTIREFEISQKLPESGRISGPLVSRLLRLRASPSNATAGTGSVPRVTQARGAGKVANSQ